MGLACKKQNLLGETVLAVGTFDLFPLPAQIKEEKRSEDIDRLLINEIQNKI
jgi:hypothetical protein